MKAIVYESNTGFTERYAKMLGEKIKLPVYSVAEAKKFLASGEKIIFMGWIMAGSVKGLKKAKIYKICAVCPVGITDKKSSHKIISEISSKYKIDRTRIFYLQGGLDISKLKGFYKLMITIVTKTIKKLEQNKNKTEEETEMINVISGHTDMVSENELFNIINWYENYN